MRGSLRQRLEQRLQLLRLCRGALLALPLRVWIASLVARALEPRSGLEQLVARPLTPNLYGHNDVWGRNDPEISAASTLVAMHTRLEELSFVLEPCCS